LISGSGAIAQQAQQEAQTPVTLPPVVVEVQAKQARLSFRAHSLRLLVFSTTMIGFRRAAQLRAGAQGSRTRPD
jgi:hypothetical protein